MFKKNKAYGAKRIDTLIGKETSFTGKLEAKGIIRIDGNFEGEIATKSDIIVGEGAVINGRVKCSNITLAGRLDGKINVENKFDLRASGVLLGDVSAAVLAVEEGALFNGNFQMQINGKNKTEKNPVRVLERKSSKKAEATSEAKK